MGRQTSLRVLGFRWSSTGIGARTPMRDITPHEISRRVPGSFVLLSGDPDRWKDSHGKLVVSQ